ncbi:MAG: hypothetical protein FWF22_08815, partial [Treponema sp.]|nr:hypothetical protein [Treponema sp.]
MNHNIKKSRKKTGVPFSIRITLIVIFMILIITASSLGTGLILIEKNFWDSVREDLAINGELAEKFISARMELIKRDGQNIAGQITSNDSGQIYLNLLSYYQNNPFYYYQNNPYFSVMVYFNGSWITPPGYRNM